MTGRPSGPSTSPPPGAGTLTCRVARRWWGEARLSGGQAGDIAAMRACQARADAHRPGKPMQHGTEVHSTDSSSPSEQHQPGKRPGTLTRQPGSVSSKKGSFSHSSRRERRTAGAGQGHRRRLRGCALGEQPRIQRQQDGTAGRGEGVTEQPTSGRRPSCTSHAADVLQRRPPASRPHQARQQSPRAARPHAPCMRRMSSSGASSSSSSPS